MRFEITKKQTGSYNCFVCGKDNPGGLFAQFYETSNDEVVSIIKTDIGHQSYPERTHGGRHLRHIGRNGRQGYLGYRKKHACSDRKD